MAPREPSEVMEGLLLGTAIGDALGLPFEGLGATAIARWNPSFDRYHLLGPLGFVSDDTEQSALLLESLLRGRGELGASRRAFRRALCAWFLRLPFGIGAATARACTKLLFAVEESGVGSAGNGAAMRAAVVGAFFADDAGKRRAFSALQARITHTDPRAVDGVVYVSELASLCCTQPELDRATLVERSLDVVGANELRDALQTALGRARCGEAYEGPENTGYVVATLALATWAFVARGSSFQPAIEATIREGGDTDTAAAILGGWLGALHGPRGLPNGLVERLPGGPFGRRHLTKLARALDGRAIPSWSSIAALLRNLALYPVVLGHGFARLLGLLPRGRG